MSDTSSRPSTPRDRREFTRTRFREGYDAARVDEFLQRARRAVEARHGSVTEQEVRDVRFDPVRMRTGYDMAEVDHELDRIAAALSQRERVDGEHRGSSDPEPHVPERPATTDGPDSDPISVVAFVRDLRWMLPATVGLMLVMYYLDVAGMRDYSVWEPVLFGIGFVVAFGPLSWLRLGQIRGREREFWRFLAAALAWAALSVTAIAALMYAVGVD